MALLFYIFRSFRIGEVSNPLLQNNSCHKSVEQVSGPPVLCSQCHGEVGRVPPQRPPLPKIIIDVSTLTS